MTVPSQGFHKHGLQTYRRQGLIAVGVLSFTIRDCGYAEQGHSKADEINVTSPLQRTHQVRVTLAEKR